MSNRAPGRLRIPQWAVTNRTLVANDVTYDENDVQTATARTVLTGGTVYFTVKDDAGVVVIQKTSALIAEIEILDQVDPLTQGKATIKFVEADTSALIIGATYWFDCWVALPDGREEPVVDTGRFHVDKSQTRISVI